MILLLLYLFFKLLLEPWVLGVATVAEASDKAFCSGLDRVGLANLDSWWQRWDLSLWIQGERI